MPFLAGLTLGTQNIGSFTVPAIWGTTPNGGGTGCGGSGCGTVFKMVNDPCFVICGWNFDLLHSFSGGADGGHPYSGLTNLNGTLYGTTSTGGQYGGGTIYSMAPDGSNFQTLWSFGKCVRKPTYFCDGSEPYSGLVADPNGNLYGVTYKGGAYGSGVVFVITP